MKNLKILTYYNFEFPWVFPAIEISNFFGVFWKIKNFSIQNALNFTKPSNCIVNVDAFYRKIKILHQYYENKIFFDIFSAFLVFSTFFKFYKLKLFKAQFFIMIAQWREVGSQWQFFNYGKIETFFINLKNLIFFEFIKNLTKT